MELTREMKAFLDDKSIRHARTCSENIEDFRHEKEVRNWVKTQSEILWNYKGGKSQIENDQKGDYYNSEKLLSYYIADTIFSDCKRKGKCIFTEIGSRHLELLQSLSLQSFCDHKSYLQWRNRSPDGELSSSIEKDADFQFACSWVRNTMVHCSQCMSTINAEGWKSLCSHEVILNLYRCIVKMMISGSRIDSSYTSYLTKFNNCLAGLLDGNAVEWEELKDVLSYGFGEQSNVSLFEIILMRAILCNHIASIYREFIDGKNELSLPAIRKVQAWLIWFQKGGGDQDASVQEEDHHDAKRYLAYILADDIILHCRENQGWCMLEKLDKEKVRLLQSLSIQEYLQHKVHSRKQKNSYGAFLPDKITREDIDKELTELMTSRKCCKRDNGIRDTANRLLRCSEINKETIASAKMFTLRRMNVCTPAQKNNLAYHMKEFYDQFFTDGPAEMDQSFEIDLPLPIHESKYIVNAFELIISNVVCS